MDIDSLLAATTAVLVANISYNKSKKKRRRRKEWTKSWLLNRDGKSVYNNILEELRCNDQENYRRYLRMNTETFEVCLLC